MHSPNMIYALYADNYVPNSIVRETRHHPELETNWQHQNQWSSAKRPRHAALGTIEANLQAPEFDPFFDCKGLEVFRVLEVKDARRDHVRAKSGHKATDSRSHGIRHRDAAVVDV